MPELTPEQRARIHVCMRVNNPYESDLRVRREAETLAGAGFRVTVIADARPYLAPVESVGGVSVKRIHKTSSVPYKSIVDPLRAEKADVYHAHDVDSLLPCLIAAGVTLKHSRVVYDSHELWSAHAADKVHAKRRQLIGFEGPMVRRSDALVSVSDEIVRIIAKKYSFRGIVLTLRNVPRYYPDAELAPHWALRDADPEVKIAYVSVFQHGRGAVQLIEALEHLGEEYVVELIGPIPQPEYEARIREAAAPFGNRVRIVGKVPAEQIVPLLAEAKISAVLIEPISESYRLAAPNKLFDSLAAGTPFVASDMATIGALTRETRAGVPCDPTVPADIARAITEAAARLPELRARAREASVRYNWDAESAKLVALYDELCTRKARP